MRLFDSHCHLQDDRIAGSMETVVARAVDKGVQRILCCGSTEADWPSVIDISRRFSGVVQPAIGLHPWYVSSRSSTWQGALARLLDDNSTCAVGEVGLDHMLMPRNDAEQLLVFYEQLRLAKKYNRPVSIHCRKAWGAMMELFRREPELALRTVIHSFSGPPELIGELEQLGVSLSFSGSITYVKNTRVRRAVAKVSLSHLLVETDSPDIIPLHGMAPNEPGALPAIVQEVAALRNVSSGEIAEATWINGCHLFGEFSRVAIL